MVTCNLSEIRSEDADAIVLNAIKKRTNEVVRDRKIGRSVNIDAIEAGIIDRITIDQVCSGQAKSVNAMAADSACYRSNKVVGDRDVRRALSVNAIYARIIDRIAIDQIGSG